MPKAQSFKAFLAQRSQPEERGSSTANRNGGLLHPEQKAIMSVHWTATHISCKIDVKASIVPLDSSNPSKNDAFNVDPTALWARLPPSKKPAKAGTSHLFYGLGAGKDVAALVSLGEAFEAKKGDARREIIRKAVGSGVKGIKGLGEGVSEAYINASDLLLVLLTHSTRFYLTVHPRVFRNSLIFDLHWCTLYSLTLYIVSLDHFLTLSDVTVHQKNSSVW